MKVLAYDRLIKTKSIAAYLSFDNTEVGRQEALGVMTALGLPGSTTWTKDNPAKVVLSGGSPTDNNAVLVRKGQMEVIQPYIDSGVVKIVADQWVNNWDPAEALKMMENILTAQKNQVDAVVASNDGTALGELQALKPRDWLARCRSQVRMPPLTAPTASSRVNRLLPSTKTSACCPRWRSISMDKLLKGEHGSRT